LAAMSQGLNTTAIDQDLGRSGEKAGEVYFFFQAEDGIRDRNVTGVQTCALPISSPARLETLHRLRYAQILPAVLSPLQSRFQNRSEERRVGKECRYRWLGNHEKEKSKD